MGADAGAAKPSVSQYRLRQPNSMLRLTVVEARSQIECPALTGVLIGEPVEVRRNQRRRLAATQRKIHN